MENKYIRLNDKKIIKKIENKLVDKTFIAELYEYDWNGQTANDLLCLGDVIEVLEEQELISIEAIPIELIKDEINGLELARQCDQSIDSELLSALKKIINWVNTPSYETREGYYNARNGR